jgi:tetratricopeptide (TPR) repeat protein
VRLTASNDELETRIREAESVIAGSNRATTKQDRLYIAREWIAKGDAQRELRDSGAAARSYEQALAAVAAADGGDIEVREVRALARSLRADSLVRLGRVADALAETARALELIAGGDTGTLRRSQAVALSTRAQALLRVGRALEAQQVAETVIREFAEDPVHGPKRTDFVAGGRYVRAAALMAQDEVAEAEAELTSLLDDYQHDGEPSVQLLLANSRLQQARALERLGRAGETAQIRVGLMAEYGGCEDRQFREVGLTAGALHGLWLLAAQQPRAALEIAQELRGRWDAEPLPGNPQLERSLWLLLADAQLRRDQTDQTVRTLRTLVEREDLLAATPSRAGNVIRLLGLAADQLARTGQPAQALEVIEDALPRLRPHIPNPDQLALLRLAKARLLRQTGALDAAIAACEQIITTVAGSSTTRGRQALISAQREKAITLATDGRTRAAVAICDRIVAAHRDETDITSREPVAATMAYKAELQLRRRRRRSALRTLKQLTTYCGDPPPEPLQRWAEQSHARSAAITASLADRRRLVLVALGLLAVSSAASISTVLRALHRSSHRRRTRA